MTTEHETVGDVLAWARSRVSALREQATEFEVRAGKVPLRCANLCRTEAQILEGISDRIDRALSASAVPVARVAEVHMTRYTIEWIGGPLPEGALLYGHPPPVCWQHRPGSPCPWPESCRSNGCSAVERELYPEGAPQPEPKPADEAKETEQSLKADAYDMIAEAFERAGARVPSVVDAVESMLANAPQPAPSDWKAQSMRYLAKLLRERGDDVSTDAASWLERLAPSDGPNLEMKTKGRAILSNPYTGQPRDYRDVESDPTGILIHKRGEPLRACVDHITDDNCGEKISGMLMECADTLGAFPRAPVDARAWGHLLVYAPTPSDAPARIEQCCRCGKRFDATEGQGDGAELTDGRWTCSEACWEGAVGPADAPASPQVSREVAADVLGRYVRITIDEHTEHATREDRIDAMQRALSDTFGVPGAHLIALARICSRIDRAHARESAAQVGVPDAQWLREFRSDVLTIKDNPNKGDAVFRCGVNGAIDVVVSRIDTLLYATPPAGSVEVTDSMVRGLRKILKDRWGFHIGAEASRDVLTAALQEPEA